MQEIIIKQTVEIPNCPLFEAGQKVRVNKKIADLLVDRGFADYNQESSAKTEKAKEKARKLKIDRLQLVQANASQLHFKKFSFHGVSCSIAFYELKEQENEDI